MQVELSDPIPDADGVSVMCRTPFGHARARWRGDQPAAAGIVHVEWTVDVDASWGDNAWLSPVPQPGLRMDAHVVVFRGRLQRDAGSAALAFGDSPILLDLADPVPAEAWNSWIELAVPSDQVEVYPYEL